MHASDLGASSVGRIAWQCRRDFFAGALHDGHHGDQCSAGSSRPTSCSAPCQTPCSDSMPALLNFSGRAPLCVIFCIQLRTVATASPASSVVRSRLALQHLVYSILQVPMADPAFHEKDATNGGLRQTNTRRSSAPCVCFIPCDDGRSPPRCY